MKNNQNGFALAFISVLVVVALIGSVGYLLYANQLKSESDKVPVKSAEPSDIPSAAPVDPTANWKTYTTNKGKYTLKHPAEWFADTCDKQSTDLTLFLGTSKAGRVVCNSERGSQIQIVSTISTPTKSEQEMSDKYFKNQKTERVTVDGVEGKRLSGTLTSSEFGAELKNALFVQYFFITPGRAYITSYIQSPTGDFKANNLDEYDRMVQQTLKFTK